MITIESHPPQSSVTTVTIDLAQLPELSLGRRIALALSLVLITSVEPRPASERRLRARLESQQRAERERLAERLLLTTIPRR